MTDEEIKKFKEERERAEKALKALSWELVREIRCANGCRLYPIDWEKIKSHWKPMYEELTIKNKEEFEEKLKELCDSLYNWGLYEKCPKCGKGIKIPIYGFTQHTPFCGCSNYPECDFSLDRGGEPIKTKEGKTPSLEEWDK